MCTEHARAAIEVHLARLGEMTLIYRPPSGQSKWYLEINGPEDLVPHGSLHFVPLKRGPEPEWAPKRFQDIDGQPGAALSRSRILKHGIGYEHFTKASSDAIFQQYQGVRFGTSYVTDSSLEADYFATLYPRDHVSHGVRTLLRELPHSIPLLAEVPIRTVLKIRHNDYTSFELYRQTLVSIVRDHIKSGRNFTTSEAREICQDVLRPQVWKLTTEADAKWKSAARRAAGKAVVPGAMLALGLISGLVPTQLSDLFKWGGIAMSGQVAEALTSIERNPTEVRNHNLYFLLRLSQEGPRI
jgi:hypothetical protein